jgi:hypothetical protein
MKVRDLIEKLQTYAKSNPSVMIYDPDTGAHEPLTGLSYDPEFHNIELHSDRSC